MPDWIWRLAAVAVAAIVAGAAWLCVAVIRQADVPESVDDWPGP